MDFSIWIVRFVRTKFLMKKTLLCLSILLFGFQLLAQQKAVTQSGEIVFLYDDNTWKYENDSLNKKFEIELNPTPFAKSAEATFQLKSKKNQFSYWLNPKKWEVKSKLTHDAAEFQLEWKGGDIYVMILNEQIEIPLESLKELALDNARSVAPDIQVMKEEYRMVNGKKVLLLQMTGTIQKIKFTYYSYYYSDSKGTTQYISYSSDKLMKEKLKEIETLLNGLVVQ